MLRHRCSEQFEPVQLIGTTDADLSSFGEFEVVLGVTVARGVGVGVGQQLCRVRTQGVEQPEPVGAGHGDHRLANEIGEHP